MPKRTRDRPDIDSSDLDQLIAFFDEHDDYTIHELAFKYGIPQSTLRSWRDKIGRSGSAKPDNFTFVTPKTEVETIDDPAVWDNAAWFNEHYVEKRLGAYIIARMIKRSVPIVYRRLERYHIERRNHAEAVEPLNKYRDRDWLEYNYFILKRSLRDMSEEAGVNWYTMSNWMTSLRLLPEDRSARSVAVYNRKRWNKRIEGLSES